MQIESQFGVRLPMSVILDAPDIERLAARVAAAGRGESRQSLKLLRPGKEGGPTLFLVHDGDGETLLYLNLARRLPADVAVYGLEPYGNDRCPILHTTIPQMAAYYVEQAQGMSRRAVLSRRSLRRGTIAFEMAVKLRAANLPVGMVALFDAADVRRAAKKPFLVTRRRWDRFRSSLRGQRAADPTADSIFDRSTNSEAEPHVHSAGLELDPFGEQGHRCRQKGL